MLTPKKRLLMGVCTSLCLVMTLVVGSAWSGIFFSQSTHAAGMPTQPFTSRPLSYQPQSQITHARAASSQLPTWSSSFNYNGTTYPYTMIGTDPAAGSATTTVPVTIVPLKLIFSDGTIFDGSQRVTDTINSPIFQSGRFSSGNTQFGDAMQRAEFWDTVSKISPNYHVLLGTPTIAPVTTLHVPSADGSIRITATGIVVGTVSFGWFNSRLIGLLSSDNIAPNMLPIFLTNNVFTYLGSCCLAGFHLFVQSSLQTFIWSSYLSSGIYPGMQDINFVSHEVGEWMNDPFNNNVIPGYRLPVNPHGACQRLLEVGDPLIGVAYGVKIGNTVYHPQDVAFFSWFARQSPSGGIHGRYSYRDTLKTYSPSCP